MSKAITAISVVFFCITAVLVASGCQNSSDSTAKKPRKKTRQKYSRQETQTVRTNQPTLAESRRKITKKVQKPAASPPAKTARKVASKPAEKAQIITSKPARGKVVIVGPKKVALKLTQPYLVKHNDGKTQMCTKITSQQNADFEVTFEFFTPPDDPKGKPKKILEKSIKGTIIAGQTEITGVFFDRPTKPFSCGVKYTAFESTKAKTADKTQSAEKKQISISADCHSPF